MEVLMILLAFLLVAFRQTVSGVSTTNITASPFVPFAFCSHAKVKTAGPLSKPRRRIAKYIKLSSLCSCGPPFRQGFPLCRIRAGTRAKGKRRQKNQLLLVWRPSTNSGQKQFTLLHFVVYKTFVH